MLFRKSSAKALFLRASESAGFVQIRQLAPYALKDKLVVEIDVLGVRETVRFQQWKSMFEQ
jgi:hypothetical protein